MTLKSKYLDWDIEIFDDVSAESVSFYGVATKDDVSVISNIQPSVRQALADTQATIRRIWNV